MKIASYLLVGTAALIAGAASAQSVSVSASDPVPTLIGVFAPGTYQFTTTGSISLTGAAGFDVDADGIPLPGSVTDPNYLYFNPDGSDQADGSFGPAGAGINIGSLAGTFSASGAAGSFFALGTSARLTFAASTSLYGLVNDTFSPNNTGAFSVSFAAVPEPATWALMIFGFGAVGYSMRRRRVGFAQTLAA